MLVHIYQNVQLYNVCLPYYRYLWWVQLAKQEMLTSLGDLFTPLVSRCQWMPTMVLLLRQWWCIYLLTILIGQKPFLKWFQWEWNLKFLNLCIMSELTKLFASYTVTPQFFLPLSKSGNINIKFYESTCQHISKSLWEVFFQHFEKKKLSNQ